jgi:uncharacterized protein YndB with AHSA1/START domain
MKWVGIAVATVALLVIAMAVIGAMLPRDHVASRSATFKRSAAELYALIAEVQRAPEWRTGLKRVDLQPPGEGGRVRYVEVSRHGSVAMEIVQSVPGQRVVTRIADESLPFGGGWTFELQPATRGGTRLTITERGEVKNILFRFMSRFIFGHTATMDAYLRDVGRRFGEDATSS